MSKAPLSRCLLRELEHTGVRQVAVSRDGKRVTTSTRDIVNVWDVATGETLRTFSTSAINKVAISDDGHYVAFGYADGTIGVWDVNIGNQVWTREIASWIMAIAASGDLVVTCSNDTAEVWRLSSGELLQTFCGHTSIIWAAAVHGRHEDACGHVY